jgi:hypothetical protein
MRHTIFNSSRAKHWTENFDFRAIAENTTTQAYSEQMTAKAQISIYCRETERDDFNLLPHRRPQISSHSRKGDQKSRPTALHKTGNLKYRATRIIISQFFPNDLDPEIRRVASSL